jgi:hypothetical protein
MAFPLFRHALMTALGEFFVSSFLAEGRHALKRPIQAEVTDRYTA